MESAKFATLENPLILYNMYVNVLKGITLKYFNIIIILFLLIDEAPLVEWEYYPHVGPRPSRGYVGLKNAGATCYMNAVLQQVIYLSIYLFTYILYLFIYY